VRLSDHLGLRCGLVRADYTTGIGSHRGNESQPAPLVAMHRGHDGGRDQKRRVQINSDRPVERREINIVEPLVSRDASAVHKDVDLTVLTDDRPGQQVDLFRVGDIRSESFRRDPGATISRSRVIIPTADARPTLCTKRAPCGSSVSCALETLGGNGSEDSETKGQASQNNHRSCTRSSQS
jgi:hypothetical protein